VKSKDLTQFLFPLSSFLSPFLGPAIPRHVQRITVFCGSRITYTILSSLVLDFTGHSSPVTGHRPKLSSFLFSLSSRLFSALGPRTSALFFGSFVPRSTAVDLVFSQYPELGSCTFDFPLSSFLFSLSSRLFSALAPRPSVLSPAFLHPHLSPEGIILHPCFFILAFLDQSRSKRT